MPDKQLEELDGYLRRPDGSISGTRERIVLREGGYVDAWVCVCGNTPNHEGFYPCDRHGNLVEPDLDGPWDERRYRCDRCRRIIDQDTGYVLGRGSDAQRQGA